MKQKALITGISGFAGSYLAEFLLGKNLKVAGIIRKKENPNITHIEDKLELFLADLQNEAQVKKIFKKVKPDIIFHLAGFSVPRLSFENPSKVFEANVISAVNLFEAIVSAKLKPVVISIGSSEVYGITEAGRKISEKFPVQPISPYGVSKATQDNLAYYYFKNYQIPAIVLRPFNHIGPRLQPTIAVSSFAKQIAAIEKGFAESVIYVGNLKARRDFTDVRDMVRAYFLATLRCTPGEIYNVGSGKSYSLAKILEILLTFAKVKIKIKIDKKLLRPLDIPEFVADSTKFMKKTSWKPEITLEKTLKDTLNYWRAQVGISHSPQALA